MPCSCSFLHISSTHTPSFKGRPAASEWMSSVPRDPGGRMPPNPHAKATHREHDPASCIGNLHLGQKRDRGRERWPPRLLAFLNMITKNGGFKSIPGNGVRNACWHSLASLLELVYPSSNTKECQPIGHNVYRDYPHAHGSIIVAFHPEVLLGYRYLYFSVGRHGNKSSSMDMSKIGIRA
jgi:hypothetical protein